MLEAESVPRRHHTGTRESRATRRSPRAFLSAPSTTTSTADGAPLRWAASVPRATTERAATNIVGLLRHDGSFNKAQYFLHTKAFKFKSPPTPRSIPILQVCTYSWSFEPDRGSSSTTWPRRRKSHFYFCETFGERRNSVFSYRYALKCSWSRVPYKSHVLACRLRAYVAVSLFRYHAIAHEEPYH